MNKEFIKREWIFWVIIIIPFIYLAAIWNSLPEMLPSHWNIHGDIDGYESRLVRGLFNPCLNIAIYALMLILPKIDPRKKSYESFATPYKNIRLAICLYFTVSYIISMQTATGNNMLSRNLNPLLVYIMVAFLGNYMRTVRPNWFIGIRTPWTLESPEVWRRTHDIGGKLLFYSGVLAAFLMLFIDFKYGWIGAVFILASAAYSVVYSFVLFKKLEKETKQVQ